SLRHRAAPSSGPSAPGSGRGFWLARSMRYLRELFRRELVRVQEAPVRLDAAVLRDAFQVLVRQKPLRQRAERDDAAAVLRGKGFYAVRLNVAVKDRIAGLVDDERAFE